jgi:hypothetical protein
MTIGFLAPLQMANVLRIRRPKICRLTEIDGTQNSFKGNIYCRSPFDYLPVFNLTTILGSCKRPDRIALPHSTGVTVISRAHPDLGIFQRRFDLSLKTSDLSVIQREALFMQIM